MSSIASPSACCPDDPKIPDDSALQCVSSDGVTYRTLGEAIGAAGQPASPGADGVEYKIAYSSAVGPGALSATVTSGMMGMVLRYAQLRLITAKGLDESANVYEQLAWLSQLTCPTEDETSCRSSAAEAGALVNRMWSNANPFGQSANAVPSQGINTVRAFLCNALDTLGKVEAVQMSFFQVGLCPGERRLAPLRRSTPPHF